MKSVLNKDQIRLVNALSKELEEGNLAIFAGAGFSREAGFVDWKTLLKPIADDLDLNIEKEWDLVTLAQYHTNINQSNRAKLNQLLVTEFSSKVHPTENHRILSRLPIATYWTTNYDNLIETSIDNNSKIADVKYTVKQLATTKPNRDAVVYKMHGDANHPADAVLIRDDYERYHIKMQPFITALSGDLVSKTFLFWGSVFQTLILSTSLAGFVFIMVLINDSIIASSVEQNATKMKHLQISNIEKGKSSYSLENFCEWALRLHTWTILEKLPIY